ncbi:unnamed protein product [Closterium sp. Yama58-4]|nr:unnamed protein product [Closterium sp. Yama58-4]
MDPEQASLFFVPFYVSRYLFSFFHNSQKNMRQCIEKSSRAWTKVLTAVRTTFPYFNRTNGRDHFGILTLDHGRCHSLTFVDPRLVGEMFFVTYNGDKLVRSDHAGSDPSMQLLSYQYGAPADPTIPSIPCYMADRDIPVPVIVRAQVPFVSPFATPRKWTAIFRFVASPHKHVLLDTRSRIIQTTMTFHHITYSPLSPPLLPLSSPSPPPLLPLSSPSPPPLLPLLPLSFLSSPSPSSPPPPPLTTHPTAKADMAAMGDLFLKNERTAHDWQQHTHSPLLPLSSPSPLSFAPLLPSQPRRTWHRGVTCLQRARRMTGTNTHALLRSPSPLHSLSSPLPLLSTPSPLHSLSSPLPLLSTPSPLHSLFSPLPLLSTPSPLITPLSPCIPGSHGGHGTGMGHVSKE